VEEKKITYALWITVISAVALIMVFTLVFPWRLFRECIPELGPCESSGFEEFKKFCMIYCKNLDETFNFSTIHLLSSTKWCEEYFNPYPDTPCKTPDKCYSQKESEHCDGNNSFSPKEGFPEKVRVSCSFYLTTGEFCNPDAIEDGWIKCCENPSLENCNCK